MNNQDFSYPNSKKLKSFTQLIKESWDIYRIKIKTLTGIIGLSVGTSFLFQILRDFLNNTKLRYSIWFSVTELISYFISAFLWLWAIPSLIYCLKDNTGIRESYKRGFQILGFYIWVYFLLTIIIIGGFLLFIIPGILFSIWFSLAVFVIVFEEKKGFNVLLRSRDLIEGRFGRVLWRLLIIGLIIIILLSLISFLVLFAFKDKQIENELTEVMRYFYQLFILPFFLTYVFLIYQNLKEIKPEISYEEPSKKRKTKYVIPIILGALILILWITGSIFTIFLGRDEPPINDSDLMPAKIEILESENAFFILNQASDKLYLPKDKSELDAIIQGEKWDQNFVNELLEKNKESLTLFDEASNFSRFQDPAFSDPSKVNFSTPIFSLGKTRDLAKMNTIRALSFSKEGRWQEAFDSAFKAIKIGHLIEESQGILIEYLVGIAIKGIGFNNLKLMIKDADLTPETTKNYIKELDNLKASETGIINTFKMEYSSLTNQKSQIDASFAGKLSEKELKDLFEFEELPYQSKLVTKLNYLYKPNQTQRIFAEYFRGIIGNVNKSCIETEFSETELLAPRSNIRMLFTENIFGKMIYDLMAISYGGFLNKRCQESYSLVGTQILLAIKTHKSETGKIINSLNDLVPEYFSEIPKDPFGGKVIKFSAEKKIIYSIGTDLIDSGGESDYNYPYRKDDISLKIEF